MPASVQSYLRDLRGEMRAFRASPVYDWFADQARTWDDAETTAHLIALTTEGIDAAGRSDRVYDTLLAIAGTRGYRVRVDDDLRLPVRDIRVDDHVIAVSAYADLATLQWVVLASMTMAEGRARRGGLRERESIAVARAYATAYCVLRALGVHNPNVARGLVLEGVATAAVGHVETEVGAAYAIFLADVERVASLTLASRSAAKG